MMQDSGDYLAGLGVKLAHAMEQRDRLEEQISGLQGAIDALSRLQGADDGGIASQRNSVGRGPGGFHGERPNLADRSLVDSVMDVLEFFGDEMDLQQLAANVRLFGYPFRTTNPAGSVAAAASQLTASGRIERVSRGRYRVAEVGADAAMEIVGKYRDEIVGQIRSVESRLPFVGLKYYRDRVLPDVVGELLGPDDLRDVMDAMVASDLVEVYYVPNDKSEYSTSAIRLKTGATERQDETDGRGSE